MANRRFAMHEIRHAIARMRLGESDRDIVRAGAMGRPKAAQLRTLALEQGWLDLSQPLTPAQRCPGIPASAPKEQATIAVPGKALCQPDLHMGRRGDTDHDDPSGSGRTLRLHWKLRLREALHLGQQDTDHGLLCPFPSHLLAVNPPQFPNLCRCYLGSPQKPHRIEF